MKRRGGEEVVALIPLLSSQFGKCRRRKVDGVFRQMGVGHMALNTPDFQHGAKGAATAVFDHVAHRVGRRGLADNTPVNFFALRLQPLNHFYSAVFCRALFVAGNQKGNATAVVGVFTHKAFAGSYHSRQAAFHIGGATAAQHTAADLWLKRGRLPVALGAGWHHIGMASKAQQRALVAAHRPKVVNLAKSQRLAMKANGGKTRHH